MKHRIFFLLVTLLAALPARAELGLALAPMRVEIQIPAGGQYTDSLRLTNDSEGPSRIRAELLDWYLDDTMTPQFADRYVQEKNFSCRDWLQVNPREVDLVAEVGGEIIPFEIKYRSQHTDARSLRGLAEFCAGKKIARAYVVTKALNDFGEMEKLPGADTRIMKVPAPLLCYWIGQAESMRTARVSKVEQDSVQYG